MFLVSFSVTSVPIAHKIRTREFAHPNAISQKAQGKYTCTVYRVGHVLKNVIELYPIQKSNVVVLLIMLRLSLKPRILHKFKITWIFFKIENGPNSGNTKPLCAFWLSLTSFCKKVIENISAVSIVKWMLRLTWMEHEQTRVYKMFCCMSIMLPIWFFDPLWDHNVLLKINNITCHIFACSYALVTIKRWWFAIHACRILRPG